MKYMYEYFTHLTSKISVPHKLIKRSFATHRDGFPSKHVSGQMEMKLRKVEEVFVNDIPRDKKIL